MIRFNGKQIWKGRTYEFDSMQPLQLLFGSSLIEVHRITGRVIGYTLDPDVLKKVPVKIHRPVSEKRIEEMTHADMLTWIAELLRDGFTHTANYVRTHYLPSKTE